jgi:hypothetical protein
MRNSKLLCKLLHLTELKVTGFRFADYGKEIHLNVKPFKNGCRCPECGVRGRIARVLAQARQWMDAAVLGLRVVLYYAPKEIICAAHAHIQEQIPWAEAQAG